MSAAWGDLVARVSGLGTHLLRRGELAALAESSDLSALAVTLAHRGFPVAEEASTAEAIELAIRRDAARQFRLLERWAGPRCEALAVIFRDEDRRSLRAIVRGIVQGAPTASRLSAVLPTPELPERALEQLAQQPSIAQVAALLAAWRHPFAGALNGPWAGSHPDLLECEQHINRAFAAGALRAARRAGRHGLLVAYVQRVIDLENVSSALVLLAESASRDIDVFLPGGRVLGRADFALIAASPDFQTGARRAGARFPGILGEAVSGVASPGELERAALNAQIAALRSESLVHPLTAGPVIRYALRLRAELYDLRQVTWGISLRAPAARLARALVSQP